MRCRHIIICFVSLVLSAALLITAGMRLDYINSQRQRMKLISNEPLENAPPSLAFATVAMGAFRGLVVDILWLRADRLKEQGQFFDAKQLAEWITTLQPRFARVWEFHAWNMAYNISVCLPATEPESRWQWIKNGYELLRDQGIVTNPRSVGLYRELARIFQHKIGGITDEAHKYYKLQMVEAMEPLLGPATHDYFKALAETPTDWNQITKDPDVVELITELKAADNAFADSDGQGFVDNYLSLRQKPGRFNRRAFETIDNFRATAALEKFDIFAKSWHLRNHWKLDPVLMNELNNTYGPIEWDDPNKHLPLDWRHPDSHAIYWAVKGLRVIARDQSRKVGVEETNTDRIVVHSLQNLFRDGKIFVYKTLAAESDSSSMGGPVGPADSQPTTSPKKEIFLRQDLRMFESYNRAMMAVLEKYKQQRKAGYSSLQVGHRNMLVNAAFAFYQAGLKRQALRIYNQLRKLYPRDEFKVSLDVFAKNRLHKELQSLEVKDAKEMVGMLLQESYFRYAVRDDDQAFSREKMAREVYDRYQTMYSDEYRIDLPDFRMLRYLSLVDFFNDTQYSLQLRRSLLGRIEIERPELAEQLRQQEQQFLKQLKQPQ